MDWIIGVGVGALVLMVLWLLSDVHTILKAILSSVAVSAEVKEGIKLVRESLQSLTTDIHGKLADLDRRVTKVEDRCSFEHGEITVIRKGRSTNGEQK